MDKKVGLAIGIAVVAIFGFIFWQSQTPEQLPPEVIQEQTAGTSEMADDVPVTEPVERTFTAAEVAEHNTPESCYAIVGEKVYELTDWINQHPGGPQAIQGICGTDATEKFSGQHGGQAQPEAALQNFYLGLLVN